MGKSIEGIITAVVTPFDEKENVDEQGFRKIINYLIDSGVNGLFPVGSRLKGTRMTNASMTEVGNNRVVPHSRLTQTPINALFFFSVKRGRPERHHPNG